jgi:PEGA domain
MRILVPIFVLTYFFQAFSQCSQNTDCKGNRICLNGECTDPAQVQGRASVSSAAQVYGSISVSSVPAGGRIVLDGTNIGKTTPATFDSLGGGVHSVEVYKGYLAGTCTLTVKPGLKAKVALQLKPGKGTITIVTVPADAAVFLDSVDISKASKSAKDMASGKHVIKATAKGFLELRDTIDLAAGSYDTATLKLTALAGLSVATKPAKAEVAINGSPAGSSPCNITDLMPGTYRVGFKLATYKDTAVEVSLSYGKTVPLSVNLQHTDEVAMVLKHKKFVFEWTFRGVAGVAGLGALVGGWLSNTNAQHSYDDYRAINTIGDHTADFEKVQSAETTRNVLYVVGGVLIAAGGISFAF